MAGAFSGHLLNTFSNASAGPSSPSIITSGAISFDARAHGTPVPSFPPMPQALFGFTPFSEESTTSKQIATLQAKLNKKLGPEYISQRPGPGGGSKLTYAEGWKIINLANEVFGFNGWSSSIVSLATDFIDYSEETKRFNVGVTAIVRVTLRDGTYHEDVGYGILENGKSKAAALDKCKKEAITDALKRTLRNFGNLLGNCLYDKSYTQEVVKIKVPPVKLDKSELYRRPEFEERVPDAPASASHGQAGAPSTGREDPRVKVEYENHKAETPITCVPRHVRQEMTTAAQTPTRAPCPPPQRASTSGSGPGMVETLANRAAAQRPNGLVTPIQTPARVQYPLPPRGPPPRPVATSPLARTPSVSERSVSFAEPMPPPARPTDAVDQATHDNKQGVNPPDDDDDDPFPLSTQEGAFFASVDLGEGDLGRPIDFDEGTGGVSVLDASEPELDGVDRSPAIPPRSEHQVRGRAGSGSSSGASSRADTRNETPAAKPPSSTSANAEPKASSSGGQVQPWSGPSNVTSSSNTRPHTARPTALMGGSHHPPDTQKPPVHHIPKPVPACVRTTSSPQPNGLKRSADVMHAGSTRPPMQGMGLAQRQQQQQQNTTSRPPGASESHDSKRFKR